MNQNRHNSEKEETAADPKVFDVRETIISTYRNDKKDYLVPETR